MAGASRRARLALRSRPAPDFRRGAAGGGAAPCRTAATSRPRHRRAVGARGGDVHAPPAGGKRLRPVVDDAPPAGGQQRRHGQIGRAACRERGVQYGSLTVVAVSEKKKTNRKK